MRIPRLLTILGPASVLYVLAARASRSASSSLEWLVVAASFALALTPLFVVGARPSRRVTTVAVLGVTLAVAVASADSGVPRLGRLHDFAWLLATLLMLDLALQGQVRSAARYSTFGAVAAVCAAGSLYGYGIALGVIAGLFAIGGVHHVLLARRGHAVEGAVSAAAIVLLAVGLGYVWLGAFTGALGNTVECVAALLLWLGHLAWIDPRWRALRRGGVPVVAASAFSLFFAIVVAPSPPMERWQLGVLASGSGALWWVGFVVMRRLTRGAIWSASGRLTDRLDVVRRNLAGSQSLEDIATGTLGPLSQTVDASEAIPELCAFAPALRIRLDAGDRVSVREGEPPTPLTRAVLDGRPRGVLDFVALRSRVVREPSVRELVQVLDRQSIGIVVPCPRLDHLEGILLLPLAGRKEPLTNVELEELRLLGDALGRALCTTLAQRRAEDRIGELSGLQREAEKQIRSLEQEIEGLHRQCDMLGRGVVDEPMLHVAYSASMRNAEGRAIELANRDEPIFLVTGVGSPALPLARFIHERGPRAAGPFVVADLGAAAPEEVETLLFGSSPGRPCWVDAATRGTLLLREVSALPASVQKRLAETLLALLHDDAEDALARFPRIIATGRLGFDDEGSEHGLNRDLHARFPSAALVVPSLRERREDVPSLALLAIDRACRVLGRGPIGIDQAAMAALVDHDWPGDVAELELAIELAVARASGKTIGLGDLAYLAWLAPGAEAESLSGTYVEVERRMLQRALRRADGNKSEAARRLGLKRTTFLDKLRRHGLDERAPEDVGDSALG